jgi:hypothetical protein
MYLECSDEDYGCPSPTTTVATSILNSPKSLRRCSSTSSVFSLTFGDQRHAMHRRSLPHMRRSISHGPDDFRTGDSRSSSRSSRPSVSAMKTLLPLRLSSVAPPDDKSPHRLEGPRWTPLPVQPSVLHQRRRESDALSLSSAMTLQSTSQALSDRDIPYYKPPGLPSPAARAYFNDEDICLKCLPPGSPCRISCVVADYSHSDGEDLFTDCTEAFETDGSRNSIDSATSSCPSSRTSGLSIQCLGGDLLQNEALWLGNNVFGNLDLEAEQDLSMEDTESNATGWISHDSGNSRWTPPIKNEEFFVSEKDVKFKTMANPRRHMPQLSLQLKPR